MGKKLMAVMVMVTFSLSLWGCAGPQTPPPEGGAPPSPGGSAAGGAVAGAVGGALLGAAIGALAGLIPGGGIVQSIARGAIAGAATGLVTGAMAGFAYGKYQEAIYRDRQQAEAHYQYKPEQGDKVIVDTVEVKPDPSDPGGTMSLNSMFTILTGKDEPVPVEFIQTIFLEDKVCGTPFSNKSDRPSGTYSFMVPTQIPGNAPAGK